MFTIRVCISIFRNDFWMRLDFLNCGVFVICCFQRSAVPLVKVHNFMHSDDYLVLEDESGRVKLGGSFLSPSVYVTGTFRRHYGSERKEKFSHITLVLL